MKIAVPSPSWTSLSTHLEVHDVADVPGLPPALYVEIHPTSGMSPALVIITATQAEWVAAKLHQWALEHMEQSILDKLIADQDWHNMMKDLEGDTK